MEEVEVPNSFPVHGEPALGGGVGVGAWAPPDDGEGMDLDSVTDMAGAGDGARSGVGGLGSGQIRRVGGVACALPTGVNAASVGRDHSDHVSMDLVVGAAEVPDQTAGAPGADGAGEDALLQAGVTGSVPLDCPGGGGYMSAKARKNAIKNLKRKLP